MEQIHPDHIPRSQRYPVSLEATLHGDSGTSSTGQIENISLTGMLLRADKDDTPVSPSTDIQLEVHVPERQGIQSYKLPVRVARLDKQEVGLQIDDYDDQTVHAIRSIMYYAVKGNPTRAS